MSIFFLGQIIELPTLNSILQYHDIKSNSHQICYKNLCKSLTNKFSGQFYSTVYGYKVVCLGFSIEGVFYPLYFELVKKSTETSAIKVAQSLVEKVGVFLDTLRKKGFQIPTIACSCDNGYNSLALSETCQKAHLSYISVPKRSEKIQINDAIYKIDQYIEKVFIVKEQAYLKKGEDSPELTQEPFFQRVRATYCNQNREIVLLFFRFNGSKKVSVIYCPDKTIFAKTLRHHWFERTQIDWASPNSFSDY